MGAVMGGPTLADVLQNIERADPEMTIYAMGGAHSGLDSRAVLALEPEDGSTSADATGLGYLLDVRSVQEVVRVWRAWRAGRLPSPVDTYEAVMYYVFNDAYLPVQ